MKNNIYRLPDETHAKELVGLPLASFSRRGFALLVDFLIAGVTFSLITVGGYFLIKEIGLISPDSGYKFNFTFFRNWYSIIWLVIYFTLLVYFFKGRTLGKMIFKIRIKSLVHSEISLWHSFERALGYGASALELGFGFFQYYIRSDRRTVHDRIAETVVIDDRKKNIKE